MNTKSHISNYFESILNSIKQIEQGAQVTKQLSSIAENVHQLEKYVKSSFETLDTYFQTYTRQIDFLSSLIEFQRSIIHLKSPEEVIRTIFAYIKTHLQFDHAFIYLRLTKENEAGTLLASDNAHLSLYQQFTTPSHLKELFNIVSGKELSVLLSNVPQFDPRQLPWEILEANSAIVFPLRLQKELLGVGVLVQKETDFSLNHLSFINLLLGMLSLLFFQHFYFLRLKNKLFKQFKFQKIIDNVKYNEHLDKGPLFIYSLDDSGIILHANTAVFEKAHHPVENVIGENFLSFLPREHRKTFENILNQLQPGDIRFYRTPLHSKDTSDRQWEFYITRTELTPQFYLNILFAVDITQHYIKEQTAVRNQMLDTLTDFSRVVNGHFTNLLSSLIPNLNRLKQNTARDDPFQQYLTNLESCINGTSGFMNHLLDNVPPSPEHTETLPLNERLAATLEQLQESNPKNLKIDYLPEKDLYLPMLHSDTLIRLIHIFAQNSLEAMKNKGSIKVTLKRIHVKQDELLHPHLFYLPRGKYIEFAFEDNGPGIDSQYIQEIFKPFFSTKVTNKSSGSGLFTAYNLVKHLKGEIFVRSIPNQSTTFFVYIPILEAKDMHTRLPGKASTKSPSILVIDDEYNIRNMLKDVFEMNGYRVQTASNGKEGIDLFEKSLQGIDLIVLDMVMPIMDGKSTFKEIMKRNNTQKVLIISGYSQQNDLQEILTSGATGFMSKPFQVNEIIQKVETVLQHS